MPGSVDFRTNEGRARVVGLGSEAPGTVSRAYVSAMREHDRKAALLHWMGGRWQETPDWRLDRLVIRLGLYLRERAGLLPGERVAVLSPLRWEWLLAEWSAVAQGAVAVAVDPDLPEPELAAALAQIAPRVVFVASPREHQRLVSSGAGGAGPETVIGFEGPLPPERAALLSEVLDLGGTLDTAERAQAFRARARELGPEALALGHLERGEGGSIDCQYLTHRDVMARLGSLWSAEPGREGDVAYVAGSAGALGLRLALLAFVVDGYTTTALGTPGREVEEIAALRPHKIVAGPGVFSAALAQATASAERPNGQAGVLGWLEQAARLGALARRRSQHEDCQAALGGRARWLRSTAALDTAISERLRGAVKTDLDG